MRRIGNGRGKVRGLGKGRVGVVYITIIANCAIRGSRLHSVEGKSISHRLPRAETMLMRFFDKLNLLQSFY